MQVMLAVPHQDLRIALELYLAEEPGLFLAAATTDAASAQALMRTVKPDLLIMSWDLPGCPPAHLVQEMRAGETATEVIVLCDDDAAWKEALAVGAVAVLSTWDPPGQLHEVIGRVRANRHARARSRMREAEARPVK